MNRTPGDGVAADRGRGCRCRSGRRRRPFQHPGVPLSHGPSRELLLGVMPLTQVREIGHARRAAEMVVAGVVDLTADRGSGASGPPTVPVTRAEVPVDRGGAGVGVRMQHSAGDGMGDDAVPRHARRVRQVSCHVGVDGAAPHELGRVGDLTPRGENGQRGNDDLDASPDLPQGSRAVSDPRRIDRGVGSEEHVGEHVRPHLVHRPGVGRLRRGARPSCLPRRPIPRRRIPRRRTPGRGRLARAGVDDDARLLRQPIEHRLGQHRRQRRDQVRHPLHPGTTRTQRRSRAIR